MNAVLRRGLGWPFLDRYGVRPTSLGSRLGYYRDYFNLLIVRDPTPGA